MPLGGSLMARPRPRFGPTGWPVFGRKAAGSGLSTHGDFAECAMRAIRSGSGRGCDGRAGGGTAGGSAGAVPATGAARNAVCGVCGAGGGVWQAAAASENPMKTNDRVCKGGASLPIGTTRERIVPRGPLFPAAISRRRVVARTEPGGHGQPVAQVVATDAALTPRIIDTGRTGRLPTTSSRNARTPPRQARSTTGRQPRPFHSSFP